MKYYDLEICGLKRKLPLINISKNTQLASFSILGDVELVDKLADKIASELKAINFDYLVGPEVKVVPLVHGVAKRLGQKKYIVCRKSVKINMISPVILKPLPHFPKHIKHLVINGVDAESVKGKKVVIIDDVVSTGVTMRMMTKLMEKVGANVVKKIVVLKQDKQFDKIEDLIYLAEIPIFKSN